MEKRYEYILILAIGITGLILVTSSQHVSAEVDITGLWKLNANGEKADLNIKVTPTGPGKSGLITGTAHWIGRGGGGADTYTTDIIGFWDDQAGKIVFLKENKVVFDKPREPLVCNTVENPSVPIEDAEICHGRDVGFTGYLFGDNNNQTGKGPDKPWMMAGVEQHFGGGTTGSGASAVRNTFGWCATYKVDMCGPVFTSMSNTTQTAN